MRHFSLAENDDGCVTARRADVEPPDEVDAAVAARPGQPADVIASPRAAENLRRDSGGEKLEGMLAAVEEPIELVEKLSFHRSRARQLIFSGPDSGRNDPAAYSGDSRASLPHPAPPRLRRVPCGQLGIEQRRAAVIDPPKIQRIPARG